MTMSGCTVYTKLASKFIASESTARASRSGSSPPSNAPTSSIFGVLGQDSNQIDQSPQEQSMPDASIEEHTPAPLNTPTVLQRAVSAPSSGYSQQPLAGASNTQRSISMVMDNNRLHGEESPVMNETLSVIDEHITDMNTPRSSLPASARRNTNDSASEYSSQIGHRLSHITGNETDEEEASPLAEAEVNQWSPTQVAEYLRDLGVEGKHCKIFKEQEISGEVLLNIDKSSIFMKELDLGPVGRRLATWHKIKAFQDEVKLAKGRLREDGTLETEGSVGGSVGGSASISQASTNGSMLPRSPYYINRSPQLRHSRHNSPRIISEPFSSGMEGEASGVPRIYSSDATGRPSAASIRDYNHSRRHSSVDFSKSGGADSMLTPTGATPETSPSVGHKKEPSFDRNWTMSAFPPPTSAAQTRASTMLGLSALGMTGPGLPIGIDRNALTPSTENGNPIESDRGYLSSGEAETRRNRNVLRKNHPGSASHSRQNSHKEAGGLSVSKRHSRFGSAGSIMEAIASVTGSGGRQSSNDALKARARTQSLKDTNSSVATLPSSGPNTSTPLVTKLDYSESPTSINTKSNPVSPATKSDGFAPLQQVTNKFRTSIRSTLDTPGGGIDKSQITSPTSLPSPIREVPLQSPTRTWSTSNSAASKSFEFENTVDTNKMLTVLPASRTSSLALKKAKTKKETSAYKSLMVLSPQKAMENCSHSGWMHKKSAKMTSAFKSRFFVLRDRRLSYYYSLDDKIEKGLIDINSHRVMFVENDIMTSLYSTLAGTKSNPSSPANAPAAAEANDVLHNPEKNVGGPFFFKLVPPRAGLSKAVQFTRPAVHYFAVDNYKEGREWFLALKKASIDRDETKPVSSTYSQKTISLGKAQQMKQRPPALMNMGIDVNHTSDGRSLKDEPPGADHPGLNLEGLNISYEHIASDPAMGTSENGTPERSVPHSATLQDENRRPQSDEPLSRGHKARAESGSTLRMARSMSGGVSRGSSNTQAEPLMGDAQMEVPDDMAPHRV